MKKALLTSLLFWLLTPLASLSQEAAYTFGGPTGSHSVCGKERWPVKTLTDSLGEQVALSASTPATVAELVTIGAPTRKQLLAATARRFPQEKVVYRATVLVIGSKEETDSDFHIVVADVANEKTTMIGEIPSGACTAEKRAAFFNGLRERFAFTFGKPSQGKLRKLAQPVLACVTGVGFFDFLHGQDGVATNGFEFHPVLSIVKGACT